MPPLSGLVGIYGPEITWAGQIACQEVNENGGVLGRPLELVIEDDGSLPESAVAAANSLVRTHHCVALIGNLLSNSRIAVAYRVAEPLKTPYLNFSFYEGSILSRYFFHFAALPNQQIDHMIPYMLKEYGPRMFFAGNNYEWPRGSIDAAKRALLRGNGEIVGEEYCPIGLSAKDIERLLDNVSQAAPDVFVPYFAGTDQVQLLTRFTEKCLKKRMAVVMGHYDEMMASKLSPEIREGFYSSNSYFMTVGTLENKNYLERLSALPEVSGIWPQGNGILTNFGEGTYICVKAFAQAANKAGNLDSEALINALETLSITSPQGKVRMDPVTHHARVNTYLTRCQPDGSFPIIKNFGSIPPVIPERYSHQRISHQATLEEDIRLQARMLEQMSEGVFLFNTKDSTIIYANRGGERLFNCNKGELIDKKLSLLLAPFDQTPEETANQITNALAQYGRWQGEIQTHRKDDTPFWCMGIVSPFTHPVHGEVGMAVLR
ncbi:MAG: PAS domain-containing protein [Candidatus Electrothrix sp. ATG2]|nr:PAS domain-containing protein [Candidatus Electrothrix sp. ATG2]